MYAMPTFQVVSTLDQHGTRTMSHWVVQHRFRVSHTLAHTYTHTLCNNNAYLQQNAYGQARTDAARLKTI